MKALSPFALVSMLASGLGAACAGNVAPVSTPSPAAAARVAVVRTTSLVWEGEQTYIALYADGAADGLVVVNLDGGRLYGTAKPDVWTWSHRDTVEICASVTILRNEAGFPSMERDCASHPITGKRLDLDEDGKIDLVETFTISDSLFYRNRPAK